jgi:hypothetical protein
MGSRRNTLNAKEQRMKWVTRRDARVDRVACPWLITRFIDDDAEFGFVPPDEVLSVAEREQAISFDAPGARYTHRDGLCTFEVLITEHGLNVPGLDTLARIVHAADIADDIDGMPEAAGLKAIADGFVLSTESDIERQQYQWPVYDALLAWCAEREDARLGG